MPQKWDIQPADDVSSIAIELIEKLEMTHIDVDAVHYVRSTGSKARAYARIWGLSRIFQVTAGYKPTYVIEVLSEHYDKLDFERRKKVIIHELLHIPHTFSGSLRSHKGLHHRVDDRTVERLYEKLRK